MKTFRHLILILLGMAAIFCPADFSSAEGINESIYQVELLKPVDSTLKVKVGDRAPGFTLKAVAGGTVSLKDYIGKKNVMISFVPAAWTPVCSDQWPGYNIASEEFERLNTVLIGITVDIYPHPACLDQGNGAPLVPCAFGLLAPWQGGRYLWGAAA
jgi:peroxiredoxin (alkyl hydroperoxide reductase subunit C)